LAVAKRNISHRVIGKAMLGVSLEIVEYLTHRNVTSAEILMVVCFDEALYLADLMSSKCMYLHQPCVHHALK
jgi:hypothetical protein